MFRQAMMKAADSRQLKTAVVSLPLTRAVVDRFVPGETTQDAVRVTRELIGTGRMVTIDHLGEDTTDPETAEDNTEAYLNLLAALADEGLATDAEVSLKLSAVGQFVGSDGEVLARENASLVCTAARNAGTTVTLDMEDHTTTDSTLGILRDLRQDFPSTGIAVQSYLKRTQADCRDLAKDGVRVRLCKGAYDEQEPHAWEDRAEIDKSYVRCLKTLMTQGAYAMVATHDPRLIAIAQSLATDAGLERDGFEFQMLYGIRPHEQERLAGLGHRFRVYLPYGSDWYGYLMRRMAEKPANLGLFLRGVVDKS